MVDRSILPDFGVLRIIRRVGVHDLTLKDHARAAIQLLSPQVDHRCVYTHLGWRHIGMYAYRRDVLMRLASLPPTPLEEREKLEQLRALEAGMRIDAEIVRSVPLGVDTPEDLDRARNMLSH